MFRRIWEASKPPKFESDENDRLAYLLHITIIILILGSSAGAGTTLLFGFYQTATALVVGLMGTALAYLFLKFSLLKTSIWTMLLSFFIILIIIMLMADGSHDVTILLFPVLIMVAALMLDKRSLIIFTVLLIVSLQLIIFAEFTGWIENRLSEYTLAHDIVSVFIILSITSVEAFLLSNSIKSALQRSQEKEQALKENNLKLEKEIADNRKIGRVLYENEKKYRALAETSTDAIFTLTPEGRFSYLNPTFEKITGHSIEDHIGQNFSDIVAPEDLKKAMENFKLGMSGEETPLYKIDLICKDGRRVPIELNMATLRDDDGKPIGRLGIARDISDRIEADRKIIFERHRAEFYLDLLSHDIANIQQGIFTSINIAEMKADDRAHIQKVIKNIKNLSRRSITLLNNVKILSKIKDQELKIESVNLSSIIRENIEDVKDMFQDGELIIKVNEPEKDIFVDAAPLISNIFLNLLHNAVKFQHDSQKMIDVDISTDIWDMTANVAISDRGPGIPNNMKKVIFQRHMKGGDNRLSGIGLSLVKELVDRYNGTIKVMDRLEGRVVKGATFIVSLPLTNSN